MLPLHLNRPLFNRSFARSFHLGVSVMSALQPTTNELIDVLDAFVFAVLIWSKDQDVIWPSSKDHLVIWLLNIIYLQL
jgi:hypothetical protein